MTAQIPSDDQAHASRAVLLDVLTILGLYLDGIVVIGGWVPELMFPGRGHVGSFDVDLALDARRIRADGYNSIRTRLTDQGYVQSDLHAGVFQKELPGQRTTITVKLDLVTGEQADATNPALIQDLNIGRLRGVELALDHTVTVSLSGQLPSGADNTVSARIADVPSFLCTKAFALNERKKEKDAYDVYFCLRHFAGGPRSLADACRPLLKVPRGREAMEILRQKFATLNSVGPRWAAEVAAGQGGDAGTVARDAFERATIFLHNVSSATAG
ncbi:MAG: nucleotidyl transferase AbiEii/AbiGii toxin family protein [Phycisphaerales bacterium]